MKQQIVLSEAFKAAWKSLKEQIWIIVGLLVGYVIISLLLSIFTPTTEIGIPKGFTGWIMTLISYLFSTLFGLGYIKNLLQALDGEEPQFSAYGQQSRKVITAIITSLLYSFLLIIGFALLILPGIYVGIRLQYALFFIVEEDAGIFESLKKSWALTHGQVMPLFVLLLAYIGIIIVGTIALGIGIFIAIPLIGLVAGYIFRKLNAPATTDISQEATLIGAN